MQTYRMVLNSDSLTILPWEFTFEMGSDRMALEYAGKITRNQLTDIPWLSSVILVNVTKETYVAHLRAARHVAVTVTCEDEQLRKVPV